jgi:Fanconi anemia group M protein
MAEENSFEKVIIWADNRENSTELVKILKNKSDLRMKQLNVADYQLSERVGVERKTVPDFLQSLIDGRLFEQLSSLRQVFSHPVLLIEGDEDIYSERNISERAINGAFSAIAVDMGVPILWAKSQLESASLLLSIAYREQVQMKKSASIRVKPDFRSLNREQEFLLAGLPKVSTVLARRLLKKFGSPAAVFAAGEDELKETEGVGDVLAKRIREVLSKKYEKSILED